LSDPKLKCKYNTSLSKCPSRPAALPELDEFTMECVVVQLEGACEQKMRQAIETEEGLGIEYDEDVVCDVCRSPEGEDGNEMVFCDECNVCVHQVGSVGSVGSVSAVVMPDGNSSSFWSFSQRWKT